MTKKLANPFFRLENTMKFSTQYSYRLCYLFLGLLLLGSCQNREIGSDKFKSKVWQTNTILDDWQENWHQFLNYNDVKINDQSFIKIRQGVIFKSSIDKSITLEKGKSYIIEAEVYFDDDGEAEFGILVEQNGQAIGYNFVRGERQNRLMKIGTKITSTEESAEVILGYRNRGLSTSFVKSISMREAPKIPLNYSQPFAEILNEQLGLNKFDSSNYHQNVLLLISYVNLNLVKLLKSYHSLPENEKSQVVLAKADSIRRTTAREIEKTFQSDFFIGYLNEPVFEVSNAYCVKCSRSSYDVLSAFNIPTRQIHFVNNEGMDIHQVFEYWHPYELRWIIIDPYHGISYQNREGELLGFTEIKELATLDLLDSSFMRHENIELFYFNLEELSAGWNENMFRGTMLTRDQLSFVY